jgi:hypothetical protein
MATERSPRRRVESVRTASSALIDDAASRASAQSSFTGRSWKSPKGLPLRPTADPREGPPGS